MPERRRPAAAMRRTGQGRRSPVRVVDVLGQSRNTGTEPMTSLNVSAPPEYPPCYRER
jgi:hypothetical protein